MSRSRNILVLTYWGYHDALVQTYTLPYVRLILDALPPGSTVHLVTLEKDRDHLVPEPSIDGVQHHPYPYHPLGGRAAFSLLGLVGSLVGKVKKHQVDTIHAWCTPAGMIGYLVSVLTGLPLVLDSFEPHAEAMVENGTWSRGSLAFKVLFEFERRQAHRAEAIIAAAEGMQNYAADRYGLTGKTFHVKPACVDLERFSEKNLKAPGLLASLGLQDKLVAVYAGKFGGIYLDKEVFELLRVAKDRWGVRFHVLLLTGQTEEELLPWINAAGLSHSDFTIRFLPHAEMPDHIGLGDMALTPVRPVPTKRYCSPIKDGEYWALGLPVIITKGISDDSRIIADHGAGVVLQGLGRTHYEAAISEMDRLLSETTQEERYRKIRPLAEKYRNFDNAKHIYGSIYGNWK